MGANDYFMDDCVLPKQLTNEEAQNLFIEYKNGSMEARELLISHNIRLVINQVVKCFNMNNHDKNDLVSAGIVGLVKAIDTYDLNSGYKFSTYAVRCINNEILMHLRKYNKHFVISIDNVMMTDSNGNELSLVDTLSDDTNIELEYERKELIHYIRGLLNGLSVNERNALILYFGFDGHKRHTEQEVSEMLHISRQYTSILINGGLRKITFGLKSMGLIETHDKKSSKEVKVVRRKITTIYEYFCGYSKEDIDDVLLMLSEEEKELINLRYGADLNNPTSKALTKEQSSKFYCYLIPKIQRLLEENSYDYPEESIIVLKKKN